MGKDYFEYVFHPIGHGLFVSGRIKPANTEEIHFVYDCGTRTRSGREYCCREIDRMLSKMTGKDIDLLTISHFHFDHVSGIPLIFNRGIKIKTVVMPYISILSRILLLSEMDNFEFDDYVSLISDPVNYFSEQGVKNIIVLVPTSQENNYNNEGQNSEVHFNQDGEYTQNKYNGNNPRNDSRAKVEYYFKRTPIIADDIKTKNVSSYSVQPEYRYHLFTGSGNIVFNDNWYFRFFNTAAQVDKKKISKLINSMKSILKTEMNSLFDIAALLKDNMNIIKDNYKTVFTDLNDTSTLLSVAPIEELVINQTKDSEFSHSIMVNNASILFSGDINLKKYLSEILFSETNFLLSKNVLIPHHGSKLSWENAFLRCIPKGSALFISASNESKTHPHRSVLIDIAKNGANPLFISTESKGWEIKGYYDNEQMNTIEVSIVGLNV